MSVSPPRPKMPSLNSLRAFEAVARMENVSSAADELCVTPAAISQHMKSLEAWAGEDLLKRHARGVSLTPLGASVLADFKLAFDQLGAAVQKLRTSAAPREIRIAALPSVAQLWLSPRLPKIRTSMPDMSISVSAMEKCPNLVREPYDLAIFYQDSDCSNPSITISRDRIFPIATPAIADRISSYSDLTGEVLLHDMAWRDDWQIWLSKVLPNKKITQSGPEFTLYALALEECKNGAGILMGHEDLVRSQLDNGSLVSIFEEYVSLPRDLVMMTQRPTQSGSVIDRLMGMLLESN